MANRQTLLADGIDLSTKGATVLDYTGLTLAGFKDSGFKNPEGIDGVLDSPSTALSGLTGSVTVLFKGLSEKQVNAKYREFKQFIRSKSFWRLSTKEDPDFYRFGKFLGESEHGSLTEVPVLGEATLIVKIGIQFKDGYEYTNAVIRKPYTFKAADGGDKLPNPGRPTRQVRLELRATSQLNGYFRIEEKSSGQFVEFGTNSVLMETGSIIMLNLGTFELIKISASQQATNIFRYIKRGAFFKVPNGEATIKIQYRANDTASWTTTLPVTVEMFLSPSYY